MTDIHVQSIHPMNGPGRHATERPTTAPSARIQTIAPTFPNTKKSAVARTGRPTTGPPEGVGANGVASRSDGSGDSSTSSSNQAVKEGQSGVVGDEAMGTPEDLHGEDSLAGMNTIEYNGATLVHSAAGRDPAMASFLVLGLAGIIVGMAI